MLIFHIKYEQGDIRPIQIWVLDLKDRHCSIFIYKKMCPTSVFGWRVWN